MRAAWEDESAPPECTARVRWRSVPSGGRMRVGLHALGIGTGARPELIMAVAVTAEAAGFATLWSGEHVVLVDEPRSRYPYSADGQIAVPAEADWLDPLLGLSFTAAVTTTIGLATGVVVEVAPLPEADARRMSRIFCRTVPL